MNKKDRLQHFSISFLAIALGLSGFTLAWQKAEAILDLPFQISSYLLYLTVVVILMIVFIYIAKMIRYPKEVKEEFTHPIKLNFYPITAKLFLIISLVYLQIDMDVSRWLWWIGVVVQFGFTIIIMSSWIQDKKYEIKHINPAWFIPVVGCVIIPIAGVQHANAEISWFFFSVGVFWWLILTTLIINRVIFHHPIPQKLVPTLFILFAPPIIGYIALTKLIGELNPAGNMLYYLGLFLFILVLFQFRLFARLKFYLSWWAYSFPLDALAIGTLLMYHETNLLFFKYLSWIIFVSLNIVIILLITRTIQAINKHHICLPEEE
jgi:tellurite resistance protein